MLTYHDILAAVAMRINALDGTDAAQLQITYSQRPLTNEVFQSSIFPFDACRDSILNAEQRLCRAIAKSSDRVLRAYIASQSNPLASGASLPTQDGNSRQIIGDFSAVVDASNPKILCTRMPLKVVERRNLSPTTWLLNGAMYALDGERIIHTQDEVVLECCVYDATAQQNHFDADDPILLPGTLAEAYINGALAMLVRDDEFVQQASVFAGYFSTTLASLAPAQMEAQPA